MREADARNGNLLCIFIVSLFFHCEDDKRNHSRTFPKKQGSFIRKNWTLFIKIGHKKQKNAAVP